MQVSKVVAAAGRLLVPGWGCCALWSPQLHLLFGKTDMRSKQHKMGCHPDNQSNVQIFVAEDNQQLQ